MNEEQLKEQEKQMNKRIEKLEEEAFMRGYEYAITLLQESMVKMTMKEKKKDQTV